MEEKDYIRNKIKEIRLFYNLTQKEFAEQINVSISTINKYENKKNKSISYKILLKIIKEFKINLNWLFYDKGKIDDENKDQYNIKKHNGIKKLSSEKNNNKEIDKIIKEKKEQLDIIFQIIKDKQ